MPTWKHQWEFERKGLISLEVLLGARNGEQYSQDSLAELNPNTYPPTDELLIAIEDYQMETEATQNSADLTFAKAAFLNPEHVSFDQGLVSQNAAATLIEVQANITAQEAYNLVNAKVTASNVPEVLERLSKQGGNQRLDLTSMIGKTFTIDEPLDHALRKMVENTAFRLISSCRLAYDVMYSEPGNFDPIPLPVDEIPGIIAAAISPDTFIISYEQAGMQWTDPEGTRRVISEGGYRLLVGGDAGTRAGGQDPVFDSIVDANADLIAFGKMGYTLLEDKQELCNRALQRAQDRKKSKALEADEAKRNFKARAKAAAAEVPLGI